jgi:hypothetical protein
MDCKSYRLVAYHLIGLVCGVAVSGCGSLGGAVGAAPKAEKKAQAPAATVQAAVAPPVRQAAIVPARPVAVAVPAPPPPVQLVRGIPVGSGLPARDMPEPVQVTEMDMPTVRFAPAPGATQETPGNGANAQQGQVLSELRKIGAGIAYLNQSVKAYRDELVREGAENKPLTADDLAELMNTVQGSEIPAEVGRGQRDVSIPGIQNYQIPNVRNHRFAVPQLRDVMTPRPR